MVTDREMIKESIIRAVRNGAKNEELRLIIDELLKEEEPVSPVEEWAWYDYYKCGACDKLWGKKYEIERWNFCPWCGKNVKWDD